MANGAFNFKNNSGNIVSFISGSDSNIIMSGGTLDLSSMTGITLGNLTLSGTTQNALSASHAASYLLTSSFNTYSGTTDTVIGTLQTSTSSLNSFSSSTNNSLSSIETSTSSLNSFTSSATTILSSIETTTGSLNSYTSSNNTRLGVIESTTGSLNSYTSSNTTNINAIHTSTSSLNSFTSSATTRLDNIETSTGSLNSFTSSATTRLSSIEGVSGSYATTGSNQFKNDQVITGSLTVTGFIDAQELRTTYISSSILYRSGSTKFGDELSDNHSFTGSLLVSGTISVPGSNLVSGSSQVLNGSGVFSGSAQLPSGIVSGSAQTIANLPSGTVSGSGQVISLLPSGTVSGSVQVDVMSTTNIARLATTGSNTFTSNQTIGTVSTPTSGGNLLSVFGANSATNMQVFTTTNHATFFEANTNSGSIVTRLQSQSASFVGTLTNNSFDIVSNGTTVIRTTGDGNVTLGTTSTGADGLSLNSGKNLSFAEGSGLSYVNIFRQLNSAALVMGAGYKRSLTGGFASSFSSGMARAAIAIGYNNGSIVFFTDASSTVANGTDITPTERFTMLASGAATFSSGVEAASFYTNDTRYISNQIQSGYNANSEDSDIWINYTGYQGGTTRFRDFRVGNGKQGQIALFDGSTGYVGIGSVNPTSKLTIYEGDVRLFKTHLINNSATWLANINFTDEVDRLGARITGERTAWDGAPMGLGFDTGGVGTVTRRLTITSTGAATFNGPELTLTAASTQPFLRVSRTGTGVRSYYWGINGGSTFFLQDETAGISRISLTSGGVITLTADVNVTGTFGSGTALFNVNASSTIALTSAGTNASIIKAGSGDELYIGGNDTWQMRLSGGNILMDNGGNVGINIGSPTARLDINGDVRYRGGIYDQFNFVATGNYTNGTYYNIVGVNAIATGIYILQGEIDTYTVGGGIYFARFVSVPFYMWDVGSNSVTFVDLPPVLGTGHHLGNAFPLFRLQMTVGGAGIFLQFNPNTTWAGLDNVSAGKSFRVNLKRIG